MKIRLLTYNLLYNKALKSIDDIINKYQPDIICLQEVDTQEDNLKKIENFGYKEYKLADYANCFLEFGKVWGVATFYNQKKFDLVNSNPIPLFNSFIELIKLLTKIFQYRHLKRTILKSTFKLKNSSKKFLVYNIHLSAFSLNKHRLKQLNKIDFKEIKKTGPAILCGDFNFPIQRKKLETIMFKHNFKEATNNIFYTISYNSTLKGLENNFLVRLFLHFIRKFRRDRGKVDYIFYRQLKKIKVKRLDYEFSDHYPLLADFELT